MLIYIMSSEISDFPKQSIIVDQDISVFVRLAASKKRADIKKISGLLKKYKEKYTSVELQHKSKEWWASVSG